MFAFFFSRIHRRVCRRSVYLVLPKHLTPSITNLFMVFFILLLRGGEAGMHENRLLNKLLDPYNPLERPVALESDALNVTFGLTLQQIIDVDEKNQILTTNAWLNLEWVDYNLKWNTSEYGGVKDLRITPGRVWKPDILMYNSADEKFDGTYHTNIVVRDNGTCLYIPPGIFKSTCKIDITWFPFDDQHCDMKFGSWTYDGFQLDLVLKSEEGGDLSSFITNGEWYLLGMPGKKNTVTYQCCPEPYVDITFIVQIRRRTLYYFFNLIVPCVLISSMALLGFTLPPDSGEKLTLGVTILLSLTVFLNIVAESMPTTSDAVPLIGVTILLSLTVFLNLVAETLPQVSDAIPLLGITILLSQTVFLLQIVQVLPQSSDAVPILGTYFNCIMFMVASSVVLTVVVLNYHHRTSDNYRMPPLTRAIFLQWMPWILRMSRPNRKITLETIRASRKLKAMELKERSSKSLLANVLDIEDDFRHCALAAAGNSATLNSAYMRGTATTSSIHAHPHCCTGGGVNLGVEEIGMCAVARNDLQNILKEIQFITMKMRKNEEEAEIISDWKFAAIVMDRFCLFVFTLFTIIATLVVLCSAPHIIVQ